MAWKRSGVQFPLAPQKLNVNIENVSKVEEKKLEITRGQNE
jgi:hypothetical protein